MHTSTCKKGTHQIRASQHTHTHKERAPLPPGHMSTVFTHLPQPPRTVQSPSQRRQRRPGLALHSLSRCPVVLGLLQSNKTTLGSEIQGRCSSLVVHAVGDRKSNKRGETSVASIGVSTRGVARWGDASRAGKRTTLSRALCWGLRVLSVTRQT